MIGVINQREVGVAIDVSVSAIEFIFLASGGQM